MTLEDDGTVQLMLPDRAQQRRIRFDFAELNQAVEMLKKAGTSDT